MSSDKYREHSVDEINNWNLDRNVDPATKVTGIMGKTSAGVWEYALLQDSRLMVSGINVSISGASLSTAPLSADSSSISAKQSDSANLLVSAVIRDDGTITKFLGRVSAIGVSVTTSPLSADSSQISALQNDGSKLRVSAVLVDDASTTKFLGRVSAIGSASSPLSADSSQISALQGDAGKLHVSAYLSDDATISKFLGRVSAVGGSTVSLSADAVGNRVSAFQTDAGLLHVSSYWAQRLDAANDTISAVQEDAGLLRVSAVGVSVVGGISANQQLSAQLLGGTAYIGSVSAYLNDNPTITNYIGRVSAVNTLTVSSHEIKQSDASSLRISNTADNASINNVSAKSIAASTMLVSASQGSAEQLRVSSVQSDAGLQHTSGYCATATQFVVSAAQGDAGILRVSADLFCDTVGSMTAFRSVSLSASQAIKATAGSIYGYYLWNTTTVPQYIKFTNTSGAINVGTDVPVFMAMVPASAAANVEFGHGIKGFTAGIGIHATSAVADSATTPAAASAVGGTIFYS